MGFFGSSDTVDGKARSLLGDLPENPSPYEVLRTVDQKAGEDVDPDDVVSKMRDLDDEIDAKLGEIEGDNIDQKDMRAAAGAIADRTDLSADGAMDFLSAVANGDVDQAALTNLTDQTDMDTDPDNDTDTNSGTDTQPPADDGGVDQKQDDDTDGDGDGDDGGPLSMLNDDAKETVKEFAELSGKDPEECVQEVLGTGATGGADSQPDDAPSADQNGSTGPDRQPAVDQMGDADQKGGLNDADLNERVADAVTSDEVLDQMGDALVQRMADNDDVADQLVQTVEQKGDFATTDDTVVTAPSNDSQTVKDASPITGNSNGGDSE